MVCSSVCKTFAVGTLLARLLLTVIADDILEDILGTFTGDPFSLGVDSCRTLLSKQLQIPNDWTGQCEKKLAESEHETSTESGMADDNVTCQCLDTRDVEIAVVQYESWETVHLASNFLWGANQAAADRKIKLRKYTTIKEGGGRFDEQAAANFLDKAIEDKVDGLLISVNNADSPLWEKILAFNLNEIPTYVSGLTPRSLANTVKQDNINYHFGADDLASGRQAAAYLLAEGMNKIVCVSTDKSVATFAQRCDGAQAAATEVGAEFIKVDIAPARNELSIKLRLLEEGALRGVTAFGAILHVEAVYDWMKDLAKVKFRAVVFETSPDLVEQLVEDDLIVAIADSQLYLQGYIGVSLLLTQVQTDSRAQTDISTGPRWMTKADIVDLDRERANQQCKAVGYPVCGTFPGYEVSNSTSECKCWDRTTSKFVFTSHIGSGYARFKLILSGYRQAMDQFRGGQVIDKMGAWDTKEAAENNFEAAVDASVTGVLSEDAMKSVDLSMGTLMRESFNNLTENGKLLWFALHWLRPNQVGNTTLQQLGAAGMVGFYPYSGGFQVGQAFRKSGKKKILGVNPWIGAPNPWAWNEGLCDAFTGVEHVWNWPFTGTLENKTGNFRWVSGTSSDGTTTYECRITTTSWVDNNLVDNYIPPLINELKEDGTIDGIVFFDVGLAEPFRDQLKRNGLDHVGIGLYDIESGGIRMAKAGELVAGINDQYFLMHYLQAALGFLQHQTQETPVDMPIDMTRLIRRFESEIKLDRTMDCLHWGRLQSTAIDQPAYYPTCDLRPCQVAGGAVCSGHGTCVVKEKQLSFADTIAVCNCTAGWGADQCQEKNGVCPAGMELTSDGQCVYCRLGRYSDAAGPGACNDCHKGSYSNITGATTCEICPKGKFVGKLGKFTCDDCAMGSYTDMLGKSECTRCEIGTFQPMEGQSECQPCGLFIGNSITPYQGSFSEDDCVCPGPAPGRSAVFLGRYYRLEGTNKFCELCTEELVCKEGLDPPTQAENFFVTSPADAARITRRVRCDNSRKCPAGRALNMCPPHREGIACDICEVGFYQTNTGECTACEDGHSGIVIALTTLLVIAGLAALSLFSARPPRVQMASTMTLMITVGATCNIIQTLGAFAELQIDWIEPLKSFKSVLKLFTFRVDLLNPGCVFGTNSPVMTYLGSLLMFPAGALVVMLSFFTLSRSSHFNLNLPNVLNALGLIWLILYISLAMNAVLPWQCEENPDGSTSVASKRSILCWQSADHSFMVALSVIGILAYVVSFITIVVVTTLRYPTMIVRPGGIDFLRTYRFIFDRFVPDCYYYGLIYSLKNLFVALIPVVCVNLPQAQVTCLACVICGYGLLQCTLQPWRTTAANAVDAGSTLCLNVLLAGGSMLVDMSGDDAELVLQQLLLAFMVLLFAIVVGCFCYNVYLSIRPMKLFGAFLCHHKGGAAVLARWLKILFQEQTSDRIFLDSDELDRLDLIFDTVATQTKHFVLIGTREVLYRMWCAGEITSAVSNQVSTVIIACEDYQPPTDDLIENLSTIWSDNQKTELGRFGVLIEHIQSAYKTVQKMSCISLRRHATPYQQEQCFNCVFQQCTALRRVVLSIQTSVKFKERETAKVLLTGDLSNAESRTTCQVLQLLLQKALLETVIVIDSIFDEHLDSAVYIVAVLLRGVLADPQFASTMVRSRQGGVQCIPIQGDQAFIYPDEEFWIDLKAGKIVESNDLASVEDAYKALFVVLAVKFSSWGSERIQSTEVAEMVPRFRDLNVTKTASVELNEYKARPSLMSNEAAEGERSTKNDKDLKASATAVAPPREELTTEPQTYTDVNAPTTHVCSL